MSHIEELLNQRVRVRRLTEADNPPFKKTDGMLGIVYRGKLLAVFDLQHTFDCDGNRFKED